MEGVIPVTGGSNSLLSDNDVFVFGFIRFFDGAACPVVSWVCSLSLLIWFGAEAGPVIWNESDVANVPRGMDRVVSLSGMGVCIGRSHGCSREPGARSRRD